MCVCRIAAARTRHAPAGSGSVAEDADLLGLEPAGPQGGVGREGGEAAPHERHLRLAHFTEPASSPWTK